jgi:hypothetical protein
MASDPEPTSVPESETASTPEQKYTIPAEFKKIIVDMTKDILASFPEQEENLHSDLKNLVFETDKDSLDKSLDFMYIYCKTFYPPRFFDILYQNNEIFEKENEEIHFLPGVDFKKLWHDNISDNTRKTIWKYLQLVLFTAVADATNGHNFEDTSQLFEAINADEFKSKLEDTIAQMQTLFTDQGTAQGTADSSTNAESATAESEEETGKTGINLDDLPNPSDIHEHVTGMMNGKLGKMAREIAEETAADLNINTENASSLNDVFKQLIQNPTKLLGLVKNVGTKLDAKMKSGDMKESELLAEASELMKKMKDMPGMGDLQGMLSKMGMSAGKGSGKVNVSAMQSNLDQKLKKSQNSERLLKKLEEKRAQQLQAQQLQQALAQFQAQQQLLATSGVLPPTTPTVFSTGETVERSSRDSVPTEKKKNKNKNKK